MISTAIFVLSTCALASASARPYQYGYGGWNYQPGFPQWGGNFPQLPLFPPIPIPQNNGPWIINEDGKYQIVVKASGYSIADLKVRIKDGSIHLRGDVMGGNSKSFSYSYGMPDEGNANEATAVLTKNGYLIVTVPLTGYAGDVDRIVPVTQSSDIYKKRDD